MLGTLLFPIAFRIAITTITAAAAAAPEGILIKLQTFKKLHTYMHGSG